MFFDFKGHFKTKISHSTKSLIKTIHNIFVFPPKLFCHMTTLVLPDAHVVRTYPKDYAASDTESEGDVQLDLEIEDEEQHSISTRLRQNQQYLDEQMIPASGDDNNTAWILEPQPWDTSEGTQVVLIRKPTASNLSHRLLNPFIYRNIQNVGTLDDLATLLDTPDDWEERYNQVTAGGYIIQSMNDFRNLPDDTAESYIQSRFIGLVSAIAALLGVHIRSNSKTKIIVGGILARYEYDLRSKTDPHFLNINDLNFIASEAKTHRTFAPGDMWYHGSRGIQVLSALYAFNCPTLLFTQRQWKLFVENSNRKAILTFPYNDNPNHTPHVNSSLVQPMGTTFLKAIVICLLSQRVVIPLEESMRSVTLEESSQLKDTPQKTVIKQKFFDTPGKPKRQSARLLGKPQPSYVTGHDDKGRPIYALVRVAPPQVVARIEGEISIQEKKEYQK